MADRNTGHFIHDSVGLPQPDSILRLFSLKGKTAIVSGAAAGIGLAAAKALAEAEANVALWYKGNPKAIVEAHNIETTYKVKCVPFAHANTLSPGYIKTDISDEPVAFKSIWKDKIPLGYVILFKLFFCASVLTTGICSREGEVRELKAALLYLASDASSYTTGLDMVVDGGYSLP